MVEARDPFSLLSEIDYKRTIKGVKVATPSIILDEGMMQSDTMADYIFDQVGGFELLSSARTTTIESPLNNTPSFIKDSGINFDKDVIVPSASTLRSTFENNNINLESYFPEGYAFNEILTIDSNTGTVTLVVQNIKENYLVEFRFLYLPRPNGIIYSGSEK